MAMKRPENDRSAKMPIESIRHKDKRKNIPTEELRDFVAEDENAPEAMLYPRDPSLDPQLVWKGKDEQMVKATKMADSCGEYAGRPAPSGAAGIR
jgi:hypothetical protein